MSNLKRASLSDCRRWFGLWAHSPENETDDSYLQTMLDRHVGNITQAANAAAKNLARSGSFSANTACRCITCLAQLVLAIDSAAIALDRV